MRTTTKLKHVLLRFDLALSMDEDELMKLSLVDKLNGEVRHVEQKVWSQAVAAAYSLLLKQLRSESVRASPASPGKRAGASSRNYTGRRPSPGRE